MLSVDQKERLGFTATLGAVPARKACFNIHRAIRDTPNGTFCGRRLSESPHFLALE